MQQTKAVVEKKCNPASLSSYSDCLHPLPRPPGPCQRPDDGRDWQRPLATSPFPPCTANQARFLHTSYAPHYLLPPLYGRTSLSTQMTGGLMRRFSTSARTHLSTRTAGPLGLRRYQRSTTEIRPRQAAVLRQWFTRSSPCWSPEPDERERARLHERKLKLGNSTLPCP